MDRGRLAFESGWCLDFLNDGHIISEHLLNHIQAKRLWLGFTLTEYLSIVTEHTLTLEPAELWSRRCIEDVTNVASLAKAGRWT